jgi:hypothetical protein
MSLEVLSPFLFSDFAEFIIYIRRILFNSSYIRYRKTKIFFQVSGKHNKIELTLLRLPSDSTLELNLFVLILREECLNCDNTSIIINLLIVASKISTSAEISNYQSNRSAACGFFNYILYIFTSLIEDLIALTFSISEIL